MTRGSQEQISTSGTTAQSARNPKRLLADPYRLAAQLICTFPIHIQRSGYRGPPPRHPEFVSPTSLVARAVSPLTRPPGRPYDRFSTCRPKGPPARAVPVARLPTPDHTPSSVRPPCRWPHVSFRQPEKLAPPKHSRRSPSSDRLSTFPALPSRPQAAGPRNQKPTPPPRRNKTCLDRKPSLTRLSVQPANPCRGFLP